MAAPAIFVVAPTFKETACVSYLLESFAAVKYQHFELLVSNGNPGDATSDLLREKNLEGRAREIRGSPELFWSGLQNLGLRYVQSHARSGDLVLLINVDIAFKGDILSEFVELSSLHPATQLGAISHANGRAISSGVKVRSWFLGVNRHPLCGLKLNEIPSGLIEPVSFLPGRCMLFPAQALGDAGLIAEKWLPHYAADYEFSNRLRRRGYPAYITSDVQVESNVSNTGHDVYRTGDTLRQRFRRLFSIKSPYNPRYRINYVFLTYPLYAVPSASVSYLARTALEVTLGGNGVKRLFTGPERGFSG